LFTFYYGAEILTEGRKFHKLTVEGKKENSYASLKLSKISISLLGMKGICKFTLYMIMSLEISFWI